VHVEDICRAVRCVLRAPQAAVNKEVFNVGSNSENYRVREIAQAIADVFPACEVTTGSSAGDNRSYRVNFDKITRHLPDFRCEWTAQRGAQELRALFERIEMSSETYAFRAFTRLKQLRYLSSTGQIDDEFRWKAA